MAVPHTSGELRQEDSSAGEPGEPPRVKTTSLCRRGRPPGSHTSREALGLKLHPEATALLWAGRRGKLTGQWQVALGCEFWLAEDESPVASEQTQSMCIQSKQGVKSQNQGEPCVLKERPEQPSETGTNALVDAAGSQDCSLKASLRYTCRHPTPQKSSTLL